jgi:hypothetical protein
MPIAATQQPVKMVTFQQESFAGGINTALPAELIADNEAQDIVNFEFADDDHLRTRAGAQLWALESTGDITDQFPGRITSIHYYENDNGDISILTTSANKLFASSNFNPEVQDITGALVLPSDTFWQWRNWAGYAIGVNRATSGNNPIKYDGTTATALAGSPKAKYMDIWNERLWLVSADEPNTVYGSGLGNPEAWTVDGSDDAVILDVGKNDGDKITGIFAFRGSLYVFKRTKIYIISALNGSIPTDVGNLFVDVYASNIGCISPYSIQAVLDDVLFLSDSGVASLVSAPLGELKTALVSQKVKEIKQIAKNNQEISSLVIEEANQYWLMVPAALSRRGINEIYVLDIRRIQEGIIRWVRFTGALAGSVACNIYVNGNRSVLIGGYDRKIYNYISGLTDRSGLWDVGYWDIAFWDDNLNSHTFYDGQSVNLIHQKIVSKAFEFGAPFIYKLFHRFGVDVSLLSQDLSLKLLYYFDKSKLKIGSFDFQFDKTPDLAVWDSGLWDVSLWDGERTVTEDFTALRQFKRGGYRKGTSVTFEIKNDFNRGVVVKNLMVQFAPLNSNHINDVGRI